ncbi:hypothetical protein Ae201684_001187 [Aphanomyces euteiches]|uniref:Uncharacterized protein n=1 Tax=Aphanomyces euteiches TaxID=100861 RepID=A0A6G0XVL7_9STRA|nr:hypothetical protein Ae201684_001187 [Aphanomyces euteiches]
MMPHTDVQIMGYPSDHNRSSKVKSLASSCFGLGQLVSWNGSQPGRQSVPSVFIDLSINHDHETNLQRNEAVLVHGVDTRATVGNRLVRDGQFTEVVTDHFRLRREG